LLALFIIIDRLRVPRWDTVNRFGYHYSRTRFDSFVKQKHGAGDRTYSQAVMKTRILLRSVTLLCAAALMTLKGDPAGEKIPGPEAAYRAFHDIFYLYYGEPDTARAMLRKLSRISNLKGRAYINLGHLDERAGLIEHAGLRYRAALAHGDSRAWAYLVSLPLRQDVPSAGDYLKKVLPSERNPWYWYSRSIAALEEGRTAEGMDSLEKAVSGGLRGRDLIDREPLFDPVRATPAFQRVMRNLLIDGGDGPPAKALARPDGMVVDGPARGLGPELERTAELLRLGQFDLARDRAERSMKKGLSFRDTGIALYWLARLDARRGDGDGARRYLGMLRRHLGSARRDATGFKDLMNTFNEEIIDNDRYLRRFAPAR